MNILSVMWCDLSAFASLQVCSVWVSVSLNIISFNLDSGGDLLSPIEALIEVVQSGYAKQICVKHKRVIRILAVNHSLSL